MSRRSAGVGRWLGGAVAVLVLAGCSEELAVPGDVTPDADSSPTESVTPSEEPSESPSESPTESPEKSGSTTDVGCASVGRGRPGPLAVPPSEVELGRLSIGEHSRLAAENFAMTVAQFFVDARGERNQALLIDAVSSPRMDEASRDRFIEAYTDERDQETRRQFVQDAQVWLRSCVVGRPRQPREVRVELVGVVDGIEDETSYLAAVRVDVERRSDRWEVVDVAGPEPRAAVELAVQGLEPLLEGEHWRQVRPAAVEDPESTSSDEASPSAIPEEDDEDESPAPPSTEATTPPGR